MTRSSVRGLLGLAVVVLIGTMAFGANAGAQVSTDTSLVTIVHGLRGQLIDVALDGKLLLPAFQPDRLTDPTPVSVGRHIVTLRPAGTAATEPPRLEQAVDVPAGRSLSLVAYFRPDGSWGLSSFTNDLTPTGSAGRVVFRNTAAVPSVDVQVDGATTASALQAGAESQQLLPAATYAVQVKPTDGSTPLLPASDVPVAGGSANFLYLVGQGDDVTWLSQRVDGLQASPTLVSTGNSGLLPGSRRDSAGAWWDLGWLAVAATAAMAVTAHRRRIGIPVLAVVVACATLGCGAPGSAADHRQRASSSPGVSTPPTTDRPPVTAVEIPTHGALLSEAAALAPAPPVTISFPSLGVAARIVPVGVDGDELAVPAGVASVGWYRNGPVPGATEGSAVIAGHVDYGGERGAFFRLHELQVGERVDVTDAAGATSSFVVSEARRYAKADLPSTDVFRRTGPGVLTLITCGGEFRPAARSYADNVVLRATRIEAG